MRTLITAAATATLLVLVGCGTGEEMKVDELRKERKELMAQVSELDAQIAELDPQTSSIPLIYGVQPMHKTFRHNIEVQADVEANADVQVTAEMAGVITAINVSEGSQVRKGQVLATIDNEILQSNIAELDANIERAMYMLKKQEALQEKGLGTEVARETAQLELLALEKKRATLVKQTGKSKVISPISGTVELLNSKVGEMAAPQMPMMRIVDRSVIKVKAEVSENHYSKLKEGLPVTLNVPALNNETIEAEITRVAGYIDPRNRTVQVEARMRDNQKLLPNMLVKMKIQDNMITDAFVVPDGCIRQDSEGLSYILALEELDQTESEKTESEDKEGESKEAEVSPDYKTMQLREVKVIVEGSYRGESAIRPMEPVALDGVTMIMSEGDKSLRGGKKVRVKQ